MIISPLNLTQSIIRGLGFENLGEENRGQKVKSLAEVNSESIEVRKSNL